MIAFASIFLGLVLGVAPIELVVGEEVARVEVLLDGQILTTLEGPPWALEADFGAELVPRELVAVAFDAEGAVLGEAHQLLNFSQPEAEVGLVLDRQADGRRRAQLTWESTAGAKPKKVLAELDGKPLKVEDPRSFLLPPLDENRLHFLRVELRFAKGVSALREMTFGGMYADNVSTELTAVPVKAMDPEVELDRDQIKGGLRIAGQELQVAAIELGTSEVIVVQDPTVRRIAASLRSGRTLVPLGRHPDLAVRFVCPVPRPYSSAGSTYELFTRSRRFTAGGLHFLSATARPLAQRPGDRVAEGPTRLADAVATAGLEAAESERRRVVLLILGEPVDDDQSRLEAAQVRGYLESLRVPLVVWTLRPTAATGLWGGARDVATLAKFDQAARDLQDELDQQRIVWVEGRHLPNKIELASAARGLVDWP